MSVINQMLRDLEARKIQPASNSGHYSDKVDIIASNSLSLWWLLLPLVIIVIVSVNVYLYLGNKQSAQAVLTSEQQMLSESINSNAKAILNTSSITDPYSEKKPYKTAGNHNTTNNDADTAVESDMAETITEKHLVMPVEPTKTIRSVQQPAIKIQTIVKTPPVHSAGDKPQVKTDEKNVQSVVKSPVKETVKFKQIRPDSSDLIHQARLLMIDDHLFAIQLLEKNLGKITPDPDYYALLANLYQRQRRFDDAIVFYKQALKIMPDKGEFWIGIALAYQGIGEGGNAQSAFKRAASSTNIHPDLKQFAAQQID